MKPRKVHRKGNRNKRPLSLEPLFSGLKQALIHDMNVDVTYSCDQRSRDPKHPSFIGCDPYLFKRFKQVLDFDKRVIWSSDTDFETLSKDALAAFKEDQRSYVLPEPLSWRATLVLQKSREICTKILGAFSYDDWFDSCSFGKRAAVELPRRKSYLDERFNRLSGTQMQVAAFKHCLARDTHLLRAVRKRARHQKVLSEIKATTVPKSFKSARIIAPDTILGGFLSRGLGDLIRRRLEGNTHIDLAIQQERHRRWAQNASVHGRQSTIDMSKASDSFTWRHIEYIVPEDWHHALDSVRTRRCNVDGEVIDLRSYMLMGSGHTFPLQTLLFYCLAEAARQLLKRTGKVSVYGDDIIIPTKIAVPLIEVLQEIGFSVNSEKSFYESPDALRPSHTFFRESCGGDYKGGVDVRPYMPECDLMRDRVVPKLHYVAWCHKLINGLLDRWDACEIPTALGFLLRSLNSTNKNGVCFVPAYEVDHAGIRHYIAPIHLLGLECSYVKYEYSYPTYYRLVLHRQLRKRGLEERPYLWFSYFLRRENAVDSGDPLVHMLVNPVSTEEKSTVDYSSPVQLGGEPHKGREGVFRWKKREPKSD